MPSTFFQIQSNKICASFITIEQPTEHYVSHPEFCPKMRDTPPGIHTWNNQAAPVTTQKVGFPVQLSEARIGMKLLLCQRGCATSVKIYDNSGGSRHLSLKSPLSCKKPPPISSVYNSSRFTRVSSATWKGDKVRCPIPCVEDSDEVIRVRLGKPVAASSDVRQMGTFFPLVICTLHSCLLCFMDLLAVLRGPIYHCI